jgi:hypothetical protein
MIELVRYHTDNGIRSAFVKQGRKFIKVVEIDAPIRVRKVPVSDGRYMKPLLRNGEAYSVTRAVNKFLKAGRSLGITDGARRILKEAKAGV